MSSAAFHRRVAPRVSSSPPRARAQYSTAQQQSSSRRPRPAAGAGVGSPLLNAPAAGAWNLKKVIRPPRRHGATTNPILDAWRPAPADVAAATPDLAAGLPRQNSSLHSIGHSVAADRPPVSPVACAVCGDDAAATAFECGGGHTYCVECLTNMIGAALDNQAPAACAFCPPVPRDANPATVFEARLALHRVPNLTGSKIRRLQTAYGKLWARARKLAAGSRFVACPGCGKETEIPPGAPMPTELYCDTLHCPVRPGDAFCVACGMTPAHRAVGSCRDAERHRLAFQATMLSLSGDAAAAEAVAKSAAASEQALANDPNVRCCPHCARVTTRVAGCPSMVCGRGPNVMGGGCGKGFHWDAAPRYVANTDQLAELNRAAAAGGGILAVPQRGVAGDAAAAAAATRVHEANLACAVCRVAPIRGPRFECIACGPAAGTCCRGCLMRHTAAHRSGHVFREIQPVFHAPPPPPAERPARRRRGDDEPGCCIVA